MRKRRSSTWPWSPWTACWRSSRATPSWRAEKKRVRDRFQELTLPEKFKKIFFKTEINREELAALIGFYFDRYIQMDRAPEIITDIDGSFAREQIIKTCTAGIMHARPDHTFDRFTTPDRATFAVTLHALIDYLKAKGHILRFTPLSAGAGRRRPVAAAQELRRHHLPGQLPGPGARRREQFQPHQPRLPRRRHLRPEKDPEQHRRLSPTGRDGWTRRAVYGIIHIKVGS